MNPIERFLHIHRALNKKRYVTLDDLKDAIEVSRATVVRDLTYLRDRLQWPIVWCKQNKGYFLDCPEDQKSALLPGLWYTSDEAYALLVMQELIKQLNQELFAEPVKIIKSQINKMLGDAGPNLKKISERIKILPAHYRRANEAIFQKVTTALFERHRLILDYMGRHKNKKTVREISPQRIIYYRNAWYCDAWCHVSNALRSFSLERIQKAKSVDAEAKEMDSTKLDKIFGEGYGIYSGGTRKVAKLSFSPQHALWVEAENWHPDQKGYYENERYILEVPYTGDQELLMDILRHGDGVVVLAPRELRYKLRDTLKQMQQMYAV